ncbi:hypothetical protein CYMTET_21039 [Cymbomonas tetramitiformis]|uniref:Reverse transcriptase Ty1/copia-type domain-containing protein n=1 Tax=Cymbomonas tetramitiformis TaxID=36881 RepID=A0AAE0G2W5_9CHLO|nr:hypothetical protein CYMTET_21039 [Cymbomonas tetramitiformis]
MEEFIKKNPAKEAMCRERYEKRKKRHLAQKTEERVATAVSTAEKMTDDEIWEAEEHAEVPCAFPVVQHCSDQLCVYTGDVLQDSWVYGVTQSEGDLVDLQRELAQQPSVAASTVEVGTPWPVTVFYLDQFTVGRIDAKLLAHLRLGHLCDRQKVVRSGMVRFDERVNDRGKLVLSWDPSVIVPLRSLFDCVQLDAPYFERFTGSPTLILDIAVYAPSDSDEFTGVVKLRSRSANKCTTFWAPASDKKEECALIDVKGAIVPVPNLPAGVKVLGMKAIYKPKVDAANVLTERKSRWVVFGNKQSHGVNYEEVYSPCTQLNTLRILLQLSLILGLWAFTMDVVTCFLNGELDVANPLYVRWPDGRMYDALLAVSNVDPCLFYIFRPDELIVFIYIHVDNFLVLTSSEAWKNTFFASFNSAYPSVDEGALTDILGMRMTFRDAGLVRECRMSQHGLIHRMLEKYGMTDCNPALSPMEPKLALTPADPQDVVTAFPYANLAMELMWLGRCTRPDILPAVCYLARFMHCHSATHWQHLLRVLRYLKGTIDVCLTLQCSSPASHNAELVVAAYSDADHAADKVTRRFVTGSLVRLNGSTVMCSSKLQKTVAVSTADAELVALSETARDIEHVVNLLSEFAPVKLPVVLHGDNHASIIQAESALNNTASRHIAVRDRYVAKLAELGRIRIVKVPSVENLADFFTKFMPTDSKNVLFIFHIGDADCAEAWIRHVDET